MSFVIVVILLISIFKSIPAFSLEWQDEANTLDTKEKCGIKVPNCIEIGDMLFIDLAPWQESNVMIPGPHNEHSAIYIGDNKFVQAGQDAHSTVCISNYSRFYDIAKNLVFVRVITADDNQIKAAVEFAKSQIGESFQYYLPSFLDFIKNPLQWIWFDFKWPYPEVEWMPKAREWYCAELLWAAYFRQGIDIDSNGWRRDKPGLWAANSIRDIIKDNDTEIVYCELDDYIEIIHPNGGTYVSNNKISYLPTWQWATVWGKIDVIINTSLEPNSVEFYIGRNGDKLIHTDYEAPYEWTWDKIGFGKQTLKVVARDEYGKELSSYEEIVRKRF